MKRAAAILLVFASAHLVLLYLNFALRYSASVGMGQAARESKLSGNLALLFVALALGLQFLIAWLLGPGKRQAPIRSGSPPMIPLPESARPGPWERYSIRLSASALGTLGLFGILFVVARRTDYLSALLRLLGFA